MDGRQTSFTTCTTRTSAHPPNSGSACHGGVLDRRLRGLLESRPRLRARRPTGTAAPAGLPAPGGLGQRSASAGDGVRCSVIASQSGTATPALVGLCYDGRTRSHWSGAAGRAPDHPPPQSQSGFACAGGNTHLGNRCVRVATSGGWLQQAALLISKNISWRKRLRVPFPLQNSNLAVQRPGLLAFWHDRIWSVVFFKRELSIFWPHQPQMVMFSTVQ